MSALPRGPAPGERARFPLTRAFLLTGLVTAIVVAAVAGTISAGTVHEELLLQREDFARELARNLNRQVHARFIYPTLDREGAVDLASPEHLAALDAVVRLAIEEFEVKQVYFFDLEGRIVYSTTPEHVGFRVLPTNENFRHAASGQCSSVVVARGSPLDVTGKPGAVNLLETYVPVTALSREGAPQGEQTGVIEIYQDATELVEETRETSLRVVLVCVGAIGALMLALWLWVRKAERTIDERTAALEALRSDLERQVEDRTRRLIQAETLATVGTLGAGVAHEVNNPVAAIASCAEGLLRRTESDELRAVPAFADFPEYLRIIRDEAFRVKEITRNLLDFSRGGVNHRREAIDLGELVRATARLLEHRASAEGKRIELELPGAAVSIRGDPGGLRQLLLNLTVNALDACPAGGRVTWELATREGGGAELACEDDGPGFTSEDLEHALEPFYTRKAPGSGTGLGLSIAYGIARQHGGELLLGRSTRGRGARVVVRLGSGEEADGAQQG